MTAESAVVKARVSPFGRGLPCFAVSSLIGLDIVVSWKQCGSYGVRVLNHSFRCAANCLTKRVRFSERGGVELDRLLGFSAIFQVVGRQKAAG